MNVYLRRFFANPHATNADRARASMLAKRTDPMVFISKTRLRWMALMAQKAAETAMKERYKELEHRIEKLEVENTHNRAIVADFAEQVGTLGRMSRATLRGPSWWKHDPRIETFLRQSVVALREQGFSDAQILTDVFIGLSVADLRQLSATS